VSIQQPPSHGSLILEERAIRSVSNFPRFMSMLWVSFSVWVGDRKVIKNLVSLILKRFSSEIRRGRKQKDNWLTQVQLKNAVKKLSSHLQQWHADISYMHILMILHIITLVKFYFTIHQIQFFCHSGPKFHVQAICILCLLSNNSCHCFHKIFFQPIWVNHITRQCFPTNFTPDKYKKPS